MSLVRLENVTKSYDGVPVLDGVDFRVEEGEKLGLIGRNGTGKTTVFRLIMGQTEPDSGKVERMRRARIACLAQLPQFRPEDTIFDVVMHSFRDLLELERELNRLEEQLAHDHSLMPRYSALQDTFQHRGGYEFRANAKRILHGLGFTEDEFGLHVRALSGGQRTRLMLALVLIEDADLLLLDEPENHLDLEAREWLETYLAASPKAAVVISHDRRTLNAVVQGIAELERGRLRCFTGNYERYIKEKELIREQHERAYSRQQELIEKESRWIDRFRYKNTKASQVQSRIKRLERMARVEAPPPDAKAAAFRFGDVVRTGQVVLEAEALSMSYGDLCLYRDVPLRVERGERIGIIGPNGCGKTTMLRHLAGKLEGGGGEVRLGHKVRLGFYDQHHENLNPAADVFQELAAIRPDWLPEQVRTYLGRFLFVGEDVFKPVSALSGGELSRVAIAKLVAGDANLLLLDEPTNHLDIASREALELALAAFPGAIVMVSHDRMLIDRLVGKLVVFQRGQVSTHLGNYTHYRWKSSEQGLPDSSNASESADDALKIRRARTVSRAKDKETQRLQRKQRRELEEIEERIEAVEETIAEVETDFATVDPADFERQRAMKELYDGLKNDLAALYSDWEEQVARMEEG